MFKKDSIRTILRIALGAVFVWASLDKLLDPQGFAGIIHNYKILPPQMVNLVAVVLPWVELVCGILLVTGLLYRGGVLIINCLLIAFMTILAYNLYRGLDIQCGCFTLSPNADRIAATDLMIDGILLIMGVWILFAKKSFPYRSRTTGAK
jgi:uncharacterized membrane protein YphA (DoxX/SURF4 family)